MKKWFLVLGGVVLSLIVVVVVAYTMLDRKIVDGGFDFGVPSHILVYKNNYSPIELEKDTDDFNEFLRLFAKSGKVSLFAELSGGFSVEKTLRQSEDTTIWEPIWKESPNSFVIEFIFDEVKQCIAWQKNNSKQIDYGSLIFVLEDSKKFVDTFIFFRTGLNTSLTPSSSPLIVQIRTSGLFDFVNALKNDF